MKPLLLGMNNPLSDDPGFDLYPYPEGSTGWRLWQMLPEGTTRKHYLESFDRRNLLRARAWDSRAARAAAEVILPELSGRLVIVLGTQVRIALGLTASEPLAYHPIVRGAQEFAWVALPHPSGRNFWYNDPVNRAAASLVLGKLLAGSFLEDTH